MGQLSIFHGNISHGHGTLHGRVEGLRDIRAAVAAHLVELLVAGAVMVKPVAEVFLQLIRKTPGLSKWFDGFLWLSMVINGAINQLITTVGGYNQSDYGVVNMR